MPLPEQTRNLILSAWREDRLAAVHIHLQEMCYAKGTAKAFENTALAAGFFRARSIENIWAADPHYRDRDKMGEQTTTVSAFNNACAEDRNRLSKKSGARADETVVIRKSYSTFREGYLDNPVLETHLENGDKDTILLTGVYADQCFQYSMEMAFRYTALNIIALTDCTNEPSEGYIAGRIAKPPFRNDSRFHTATLDDVRRTLPLPGPSKNYA